ncbi:MAG: DMT family transporter [Chloroflexota bacterium]|nr:DMT family transporter [Chloroflexota bacterium]MDE2884285.1 DMT family transporter [Chloroflexota bacterium]
MSLGILLAMVAALGWGAGDVLVRRAMFTVPPELVVVFVVGMVATVLGIVTISTEGLAAFGGVEVASLGIIAVMGALAWVTGNLFYFHGLRRAGVTLAAPILGAGPLFAIALAVVFAGERPNLLTVGGAFAVVIGVAVILTDRNRVLR